MAIKNEDYQKFIDQELGYFNEDDEWCWALAQPMIVTANEIEEVEHGIDVELDQN